ncbi:MAG: 4-hydroxy-3-methylbut-2-enyl diphosphate reductase [Candidatus Nanoarchaeia archaeon]|jgi:4-hydroxy-3-methylbut-2-enyl diphosphate reductase|nr:4-hydroxy-3-methylbut-2-enyl diphosphate reductase [Candidatus Nanoarchaeia archaeon]|tara:strand:+ start:4270 stop:5181 length:912 start_codon:yes stop_codon:yes gene_type:complete
MISKIILVKPRGFCAGVERAIEIVEKALEIHKKVYVKHQIVHNLHVVKDLEKKGAIFVEELNEIPNDNLVIFSAHGVSPKVVEEAKKRNLKFLDATCPLVTKVHLEAIRYNKENYSIILIGHKGHQEVIGTMGEAPMFLVGNIEDVNNLDINSEKIAYITQTTLSLDDTKNIVDALKKKYPNIESPKSKDICYATQNRQNAIKELAKTCELVLVVGSKNSSNSNRLVETAKLHGCKSYLIENKDFIDERWLENVENLGISSGASAPEILVQELVDDLKNKFNCKIKYSNVIEENIKFTIPTIK